MYQAALLLQEQLGEAYEITVADRENHVSVGFSAREVSIMSVNFLGGNTPVITVTEPSTERVSDKERLVSSRIERWLKG